VVRCVRRAPEFLEAMNTAEKNNITTLNKYLLFRNKNPVLI